MIELAHIFLDVVLPVFAIVLLGYALGDRLALQSRTLSRTAYYVFVPAFIFQAIGNSELAFEQVARLSGYTLVTHCLAALIAGCLGRLLGRSREMIAAFVMIAMMGNVGNFGLAIIRFRLGDAALPPATIYYVVISVSAFIASVGAAGWAHGGGRGAVGKVLLTPAVWSAALGLLAANSGLTMPLAFSRMIGLLADAMIPVMLFALGLQLLEQKRIEFSLDVATLSAVRLFLVPLLAWVVAAPFALSHLDFAAGVLQAGMPTAVMTTIIAKEHQIVPAFVTSVVVVSVLASLFSLPLLMVLL